MIPMYFMIILWGGPNRIAAGLKFILYSLTGSLLLLVGILGLYVQGGHTFDILALTETDVFFHLSVLDVPGLSIGLWHQAADVSVSHLAA